MAYRSHGEPGSRLDLPVVALVHSLAMDDRFWDAVAQRLAG